jgi:hypothetical protein
VCLGNRPDIQQQTAGKYCCPSALYVRGRGLMTQNLAGPRNRSRNSRKRSLFRTLWESNYAVVQLVTLIFKTGFHRFRTQIANSPVDTGYLFRVLTTKEMLHFLPVLTCNEKGGEWGT